MQAEVTYYQDLLNVKHSAITNFWKVFGQTLNHKKSKNKTRIQQLHIGNESFTSDKDIANGLNDYFCSVGYKTSNELPQIQGHYRDYLKNKIEETFFLAPILEQETSRELLNLNSKKSAGPDNFAPRLIKACASALKEPLTLIYNKAVDEANFPSD